MTADACHNATARLNHTAEHGRRLKRGRSASSRLAVLAVAFPILMCFSPLSYGGEQAAAAAHDAERPQADFETIVGRTDGVSRYWRFEGDLKPTLGTAASEPKGDVRFSEGPIAGRALRLDNRAFVILGGDDDLRGAETTLELSFCPDVADNAGYNPCLIAVRGEGDHRNTMFSVHLWRDYSCVGVWNGRRVVRFEPPAGTLKRGRWHHLAIISRTQQPQMHLYLDGVLLTPDVPGEKFNYAQKGHPLLLGSSTAKGQEWFTGAIDEVAIYRRALTAEEIAQRADAVLGSGRRDALAKAVAEEERLRRERLLADEKRRDELKAAMLASPQLIERGTMPEYRGASLEAISMPLGGIGAGCIQIDGNGELARWQIFGNHEPQRIPHCFLAVRAAAGENRAVVRALQAAGVGPFAPMAGVVFRGIYPIGCHEYVDNELPVRVRVESFSPLIPLNTRDSSIPCAVFRVEVENPTSRPVRVSLLASQQNCVGYQGKSAIREEKHPDFGGNCNRAVRTEKATRIHMTAVAPDSAAAEPGNATERGAAADAARGTSPGAGGAIADGGDRARKPGDLVLAVHDPGARALAGYGTWESLAQWWESAPDAAAPLPAAAGPTKQGETLNGAVASDFELGPGEKRTTAFVLCWHFPEQQLGSGLWGGRGVMYSQWWDSAAAVADYLEKDLPRLAKETALYRDTLCDSTLPYWLIERVSSQVAVLRTPTCFWTADGYFGGWEGCSPAKGCCPGNCNHVWHYAQAHARLFPEIARLMRAQEFRHQEPNGAIPHRQPKSHPACDGQCGAVLNSYREHLLSKDDRWLKENWPNIRRAMEFVIARWDADEDGCLSGPQWNTLDGNLGGNSSWLGSLYLAALRAAEEMARLENDAAAAERFRMIFARGSAAQDRLLFNGEYYIQIPERQAYQDYGQGCHIDQVLGQWWADQLDLGEIYPRPRVQSALRAIFAHNFRADFRGVRQAPRVFVAPEDPGMQMICWPRGDRPADHTQYADEVMTGFEYAAAAAMIGNGLLREGLTTARAVHVRYDGRRRSGLTGGDYASWGYSGNPFGDDECGKFYARAMSSWSLLLACQGLFVDGPRGVLAFRPVWQPENHRSFLVAAEGWGTIGQEVKDGRALVVVDLRYGSLRLNELELKPQSASRQARVAATAANRDIPCKSELMDGRLKIRFAEPLTIAAGERLTVAVDFADAGEK